MTRDRRVLAVFWLAVLLLTVGAFTADALFRAEVCISAIHVDQSGTVAYTPTECT